MIDPDKAIEAFKKKFGQMTYAEREDYLKEMGFSFDNKKHLLSSTVLSDPSYKQKIVRGEKLRSSWVVKREKENNHKMRISNRKIAFKSEK